MKAYIKDIAVVYPSRIVTNDDLVNQGCKWTSTQIKSKIGVDSRHFCEAEESSLTLGLQAARVLLNKNPEIASHINHILFSTLIHDHFMINSAAYVQKTLNLPENVTAIDFKLGCSGYTTLLSIAKALIESGDALNVLVITADTYSKMLDDTDFSTMTVFGDGATASLISTDGIYRIVDCASGTDGTGSYIHAQRIGMNCELTDIEMYGVEHISRDKFYMVGEEIFDFVCSKIPDFITSYLKKENSGTVEPPLYLFHQANQYMLNYLRKRLMIPKEQFYIDIASTGNTSTSSIPIALNKILENPTHKKIICCGFGGGYCWNAMTLERK